MKEAPADTFYRSLPVFTRFEGVADADNYSPLPEDWILALADIVGSTSALEAGRYKDVNMVGASVISAVLNAVNMGDYPFAFGGDGALLALPSCFEQQARMALAAVQVWAGEEMGLTLRIAVVPIGDIRRQGLDVRVARYGASPNISYAMFAGGGASWAEAEMKRGNYGVEPAAPSTRPDLAGLSCRWNPIGASNGEIVSIIAVSAQPDALKEFQDLVGAIIAVTAEQNRNGHPVPEEGPDVSFFSQNGVESEVKATAPKGKRFRRRLVILWEVFLAIFLQISNITISTFNFRAYRREVSQNSDFRKFDDGLKMTIDVDEEHLRRIEALLEEAERRGICHYGLHRQDSALVTCIVPSPLLHDHIHFIDGAGGGYSMAASRMKAKKPPAREAGAAIALPVSP
ncbi:DUF3095 domain-containing protein [Rhizobium sp. BK251]|uniref:DUF3095 domain-containing protein n=1 Tax=Rhizobium sp. BK251 TaxID=2512125 RepID=UPI001042C3FF|nr:DUF3095 domain-containing protein [Rhizobium sp. BK251]TCL68339.1 DUF3095 family protein [Rhizobium sp. BK251]